MINIFDQNGYLDWDKINKLTKKTPYLFIVSARGVGKSYGCLLDTISKDKRFLYIRRTKTQYEVACKPEASPFKALEADKVIEPLALKPAGKDLTGVYKADIDDEGKKTPYGFPIGYMSSLSCFANLRGTSFEDVEVVIYDEFIPESHERPLRNEGQAFLNLLETVGRNRELQGKPPLRVICLANANDIGNKIFAELDLIRKADDMMKKHQSISINEERGLCLIILDHSPISERKKHTALYKLTACSSGEFNEMALENRFYQDESALIRSCNLTEYIPICTVTGITIYKHKSEKMYYVSTYKTGSCREYGTSYAEKKRFINNHMSLWMSYLRNRVVFEEYLCLILFEQAFDATR